MYYIERISGVVILAALAAGGWFSVRLAQANTQFLRRTPASVARALELMPLDTEYLEFRALQLEYEGAEAGALLEKAASLNPRASAARIRLGLAAEMRSDFPAAQRWLEEAARIDRQFEPRWTLANFYFRRQDAEG